MYLNFLEMADTFNVPTLGIVSEETFHALPIDQQRKISGYGTIETIGVEKFEILYHSCGTRLRCSRVTTFFGMSVVRYQQSLVLL